MDRVDLLLSLEEHRHIDGHVLTRGDEGTDSVEESQQLALVVGGTSTPHEPVLHDRVEGWADPLFDRINRLNVVVAVQEDGGGVG